MELCLICDNPGKKFFTVKEKIIARCETCDLSWTEKFTQPTYDDYHFDSTYSESSIMFENIFRRLYRIANKHFAQPGKMLEIGSSVGNLLQIFKNAGWKVLGIEPSKKACQICEAKKLRIKSGKIEDVKLPSSSFDLVIINHTLEHLENPLQTLRQVYSLLKPNGVIMIGVPNFGSLSAKILKNRWYYILPEEHKWHFSPKSLEKLLLKAKFTPFEYRAASGIFDYDAPFVEIINSFWGFKKQIFNELLTAPMCFVLTKLKLGTGLVMLARK